MRELKFRSIFLLITIMALLSGCATTNGWIPMGHDEMQKGNYGKAVEYFKKGLEEGDKCYTVYGFCYWYLCDAYYKNGQFAEAYEACKQAVNYIIPLPEEYWSIAWNLGLKEEVINSIKKHNLLGTWTSGGRSGQDLFHAELAYYSNKLGRYDDAIIAAKRGIELFPDDYRAFLYLGDAYRGKKQYDNAIAAYKKAVELNPNDFSGYLGLSACYAAKKQYDSEIKFLQKAQELAPDNPDILFAIGSYYMRMGNFDEAINSLNEAISLRTIARLGLWIAIKENYPVVTDLMEGPAKKAGVEVGDKIIKINSQSTKGWDLNKVTQTLRRAEGTQVVLTIERKNLDNPIEKTVTREIIIDRSAASSLGLRSLIYRIKGNAEDAEKDAQRAYSLDPDNDNAKEALGAIYLDKGKYDEAIRILSNTSKEAYSARILEATAYAKKGEYKKAVEIYSSIPEDYFTSKSAFRERYINALFESLKPYVNIRKDTARSLEAKGQYREALNEYVDALKVADDKEAKKIRDEIALLIKKNPYLSQIPEEARKYALRGEALLKDGKLEEALKEYKTAIKMAPYIAVLYRTTALIYGELKDYSKAIDYMNIYLELMPDAPDARGVKDQIYKWEFMLEREKTESK